MLALLIVAQRYLLIAEGYYMIKRQHVPVTDPQPESALVLCSIFFGINPIPVAITELLFYRMAVFYQKKSVYSEKHTIMDKTLEKLKDVTSDCCVTIILQTHRTLPDNEKDAIVLRNLIKEAETRLQKTCEKALVTRIMKKINDLTNDINHRFNLESLILFANEDMAAYTRLPVAVDDRVVIDKSFATRDLIRALQQETSYYVLILSRDEARLVEAFNDKVVSEIDTPFPMVNVDLHPRQRAEAAIGNRMTNLILEFFNRVDKQLNEVLKENPLPVIICTEESNYADYLKIADNRHWIVGNLNGNRMQEKAHHVVDAAWPVMKQLILEKNRLRLEELRGAVSSGNVLTDFNEIWQAASNGRGKTLFVKRGYFQPAQWENNTIRLLSEPEDAHLLVEDIIGDMIEKNRRAGGETVFVRGDELEKFQNLALVTRY